MEDVRAQEDTDVTARNPDHSFWRLAEAYLRQPLFVKEKPVFFNPFKFKRDYELKFLERCWQFDYKTEIFRFRLETCWQAEKPSSTG